MRQIARFNAYGLILAENISYVELTAYLEEKGIYHGFSYCYTSQQNIVAE